MATQTLAFDTDELAVLVLAVGIELPIWAEMLESVVEGFGVRTGNGETVLDRVACETLTSVYGKLAAALEQGERR